MKIRDPGELNFFDGKKIPAFDRDQIGTHDLLLLTDADCRPVGPHWIALMQGVFQKRRRSCLDMELT